MLPQAAMLACAEAALSSGNANNAAPRIPEAKDFLISASPVSDGSNGATRYISIGHGYRSLHGRCKWSAGTPSFTYAGKRQILPEAAPATATI
jgi:hypothetical protein